MLDTPSRPVPTAPEPPELPPTARIRAWRRFVVTPGALPGSLVLACLALGVVLGPMLGPYAFDATDLHGGQLLAPDPAHWLGTDELGRDVLTRWLHAGRVSGLVGLSVAGLASVVGGGLGAIAGWWGRWVDGLVMRLVDVLQSIPLLMLLMVLGAITRPTLAMLVLLVALTSWTGVARIVRAQVLAVREREFIEAARAAGMGPWSILWRHALPHALGPVVVATTLGVGDAIALESALSYLGMGIQPPTPSWGNMLSDAQHAFWTSPALALYPGIGIALGVASLYLLGEGLRAALTPRE
jgi:peptide/nickel transport system permease protein